MNVLDDALIQDLIDRYEDALLGTEEIGLDESIRLVLELTWEIRRLRDELFPKQKQLKQPTKDTDV